ncbi:MAG: S8 family serine peptidase [Vicinamibacterales bacterium]
MNASSQPARYLFGFLAVSLIVVAAGVNFPVAAQGVRHRARLAQGLEQQLATGAPGTFSVLLEASQSEVDRLVRTYGVRADRRLQMGARLVGSARQLNALAADANVGALNADDVVTSTMAVTTQATGAAQLWRSSGSSGNFGGLTGLGIGVAVIDSGISGHPDLVGRLRTAKDFTDEGVDDRYGHGTHVAGIIAGSGGGSRTSDGNSYVGMAPGAELISLRVLAADGTGYVSDVIEAIEWAVANQTRFRIRVLNLSLGHPATSAAADDPLAQAVERAVASGLVVVCSAGNLGKTADGTQVVGGVVSPGYTPGALTVGALNTRGTVARSDDGVASYSSRGPVGDPFDPSSWQIKPDVVAPGNAITSTGAVGSTLWESWPERRVAGTSGGAYLTLSGSSMATAVVSGAVAQLIQLQPKLTPAEVKFALQFTAQELTGFGLADQGAGSVNIPLAAAFIENRDVVTAPIASLIGGEVIEGWHVEPTLGSAGAVTGHTFVWGGRVTGDTTVLGGRGVAVTGDTIVWGGRSGSVTGDTIVWGGRTVAQPE